MGVNTLSALKGVHSTPAPGGRRREVPGQQGRPEGMLLRELRRIPRDLTRMWDPRRKTKKHTQWKQIADTENRLLVARCGGGR